MSDDGVPGAEPSPAAETFNHRQALLELFADLELRHEVVRHSLSLRGYNAALTRLDQRALDSVQMAAPAHTGAIKVAPLPGILRVPSAALDGESRRHHRHHHHHHRHRHCETIAEESHQDADQSSSDVTTGSSRDVTVQMSNDVRPGGSISGSQTGRDDGRERAQESDSGYYATDESDSSISVQRSAVSFKHVTAV